MIEQPARLVGLKFEQGVVDRLVNDVAGEPWSLPLLQFALARLWDAREGSRITWRSYHQSLGPVGAFSAPEYRAESVYNELQPHERLVAQNLFKRLVRPREGRSVTLIRALGGRSPQGVDPRRARRRRGGPARRSRPPPAVDRA